MAEFHFSTEAPREWDSRCAESGAVIGTTDWQAMLESSFGCSTHSQASRGYSVVTGLPITMSVPACCRKKLAGDLEPFEIS